MPRAGRGSSQAGSPRRQELLEACKGAGAILALGTFGVLYSLLPSMNAKLPSIITDFWNTSLEGAILLKRSPSRRSDLHN